jgi:acyl carrier protein
LDELVALIRSELRIEEQLDATTPLLSSGLIDSLGVVVLLTALEARYGVVIDEADVSADTFDTPAQILELVEVSVRTD